MNALYHGLRSHRFCPIFPLASQTKSVFHFSKTALKNVENVSGSFHQTMSTKQIDQGLENYYNQKGVRYLNDKGIGKFAEWADENGYDSDTIKEDLDMIDPGDSSIIEFDDNFPTDKEGDERLEEIFRVLQICWKTPMAFEHSSDIHLEPIMIRLSAYQPACVKLEPPLR